MSALALLLALATSVVTAEPHVYLYAIASGKMLLVAEVVDREACEQMVAMMSDDGLKATPQLTFMCSPVRKAAK